MINAGLRRKFHTGAFHVDESGVLSARRVPVTKRPDPTTHPFSRTAPMTERGNTQRRRSRLLSCPYCAGRAVVAQCTFTADAWEARCSRNSAADPELCPVCPSTLPMISAAAAAAAWNTRTPPKSRATKSPRRLRHGAQQS
jgi:hypothetical protein